MKNLIIIGAGGCGREVLQWAKDINQNDSKEIGQKRWNIKGFIDDDLTTLQDKQCSVSVLSKIDEYEIEDNDEFICCIGNGLIRKMIVDKMKAKGARFINVIHPTAVIADSCTLGNGVVIYPFALISDNAKVGDGSIINMYSSVAHDSSLGEYCTISAHCDITGMCKLGNMVFMGTTSNMVPSSKVGNNVYICAGSTVMSRIKDNVKVLGNPAKIMKF